MLSQQCNQPNLQPILLIHPVPKSRKYQSQKTPPMVVLGSPLSCEHQLCWFQDAAVFEQARASLLSSHLRVASTGPSLSLGLRFYNFYKYIQQW